MKHLSIVLPALLVAAAVLSRSASGLTLSKADLARANIVVGKEAGKLTRFAAFDLQDHIRKMAGVKVPLSDRPPADGFVFYVGRLAETEGLRAGLTEKDRLSGAFRMAVDVDSVKIIGASPRGTAHGVYVLLEEQGCCWYWPWEVGTYIPRRDGLDLAEGTRHVRPAFWSRQAGLPSEEIGQWPIPEGGGGGIWLYLRNRAGSLGWRPGAHSYPYLIPNAAYFEEHPEYFALIKGKRKPPNLCTANDEVVKAAARQITTWLAKEWRPVAGAGPPDNGGFWCECELCRKRYPLGKTNISDRVVDFANRVGEIVEKEFPEVLIAHYIYAEYVNPPRRYRSRDNLLGWFTLWSTTGYTHHAPFTAPENEKARKLFEANAALYKHMGIYAYYGHYIWFTSWPMGDHIAADLPYWRKHGVELFYSENHGNWATQWWNFYLQNRYMWDTSLDIEEIRTEYYRDFLGEAGKWMRKYDERIRKAFASKGCVRGAGGEDVVRYTSEVLREAGRHIASAKQAAAAQGSPYVERMVFLEKGYTVNRLWCSAHHHLARFGENREPGEKIAAVSRLKQLYDFIQRPENVAPLEVVERKTVWPGIRQEILNLEQGMTFSRGAFGYGDGLGNGGRAKVDALDIEGFRFGSSGLNLPAGRTGMIEWELIAAEGAFAELALGIRNPSEYQYRVAASIDGGESHEEVKRTDVPDFGYPIEFDLSSAVRRGQKIRVRVRVTNRTGGDILALDKILFKGMVE